MGGVLHVCSEHKNIAEGCICRVAIYGNFDN